MSLKKNKNKNKNKNSCMDLTDILGEILVKVLLESLKISHFF